MGFVDAKTAQLKSMDADLRMSLWNSICSCMEGMKKVMDYAGPQYDKFVSMRTELWINLMKYRIDMLADYNGEDDDGDPVHDDFPEEFAKWYFHKNAKWYMPYCIIETMCEYIHSSKLYIIFENSVNACLEGEVAGYRLLNIKFIALTNEIELQEVGAASSHVSSGMNMVTSHIKSAVSCLSSMTNPDYTNCMKESISAVECSSRLISGMSDVTMMPALENTVKKLGVSIHLLDSMRHIWKYSNEEFGVRHGKKDMKEPQQEDARHMLVTCSAFVNMIVEKARKQGKLPT